MLDFNIARMALFNVGILTTFVFLFPFFSSISLHAQSLKIPLAQAANVDEISAPKEDLQSRILSLNDPTVVLTHKFNGKPFDPLYASITSNIRTMRLLYDTPVRYDENGRLISNVLTKFSFDNRNNEISFTLKPGLKYSDNSNISIQDIAMAVKRMLLFRPQYPTLNKIKGLDKWLKTKYPLTHLPEGMTIKGNTLVISFTQKTNQPFQWFAYEIFAIIPEKCIDKFSSSLLCDIPPFSGEYELVESEPEFMSFKKRVKNTKIPEKIRFLSISTVKLIKYLDKFKENHVVIAEDIYIPPTHRSILKMKFRQNAIPETRTMALMFNKKFVPFDDKRTRQFFAKEYRKTLDEHFGQADGSIFTRIMPGYIPIQTLNMKVKYFTQKEEREIINKLRKYPPLSLVKMGGVDHDPFHFYLKATLKRLKIFSDHLVHVDNMKEENSSWKIGKQKLRPVYASLSSLDPTDDLRMLFSKNMYYFLKSLADDQVLQDGLKKIRHSSFQELDLNNLKAINSHLYEDSVFSVVLNYSVSQFTLIDSPLKFVNDWTSNTSHYFVKR